MTAGGNKDFVRCDNCYESMGLTDPNFTADSHGGYFVVRVADSLSVVVINNISSIEVEIYRNTEDDAPIETVQFSKGEQND
jgi:hypothetical protein